MSKIYRSPEPWSYDPETETVYDADGKMVANNVAEANAGMILMAPGLLEFTTLAETAACCLRIKAGNPLLRSRASLAEAGETT